MHAGRPIVCRLVIAGALVVAACSPARSDDTRSAGLDDTTATSIDAGEPVAGCDPLNPRHCLLPFPSDAATVADSSTPTGRRVALPAAHLLSAGGPVDVTEWNRLDGFGLSGPLLADLGPDVDPASLPSWTDLPASLDDDATIVLVEAPTGERVPLWAELAGATDPVVTIRPAVTLRAGTRYVVGVRGVTDGSGAPVTASAAFAARRDGDETGLEPAFEALAAVGVARDQLQLAWQFTTASEPSASLLARRDATLANLASFAPEFEIVEFVDRPDGTRLVSGRLSFPIWGSGEPPELVDVEQAPFTCHVPAAALQPGRAPLPPVVASHDLGGSHLDVDRDRPRNDPALRCSTNWIPLAGGADDVESALGDLAAVDALVDSLVESFAAQLSLIELVVADNGLATEPAFQRADGTPVFRGGGVSIDGNGLGASLAVTLAATSPNVDRVAVTAPATNLSLVAPRSARLAPAVELDTADDALRSALAQMRFDTVDGAAFAHHLREAPVEILVQSVIGDQQVSELAAQMLVRTVDVPIHWPNNEAGRSLESLPGWPVRSVEYGVDTSVSVLFDAGAALPPVDATAPTAGADPHDTLRRAATAVRQRTTFLTGGGVVDVCEGRACTITDG